MINTQFVSHQSIPPPITMVQCSSDSSWRRLCLQHTHTHKAYNLICPHKCGTNLFLLPLPILHELRHTNKKDKSTWPYINIPKQTHTHTHTHTHTKTNWVCFAVSCEPWKVRQKWCEKLNHLLSNYQRQEYSPPDHISTKRKHGRDAKNKAQVQHTH